MIALTRQTLIRSLPVYGAVVGGLIAAMSVLLASTETLESAVWTTGVAALVPAAAPPLGTTARALLALGSGALVAALLWSSLFLLFGPGGVFAKASPREDGVPVIRRADAHPDAPPRKPMSAADLGTPMMEVGVGAGLGTGLATGLNAGRDERTIPADLDQPLAAFDPKAILPVPMEPVRPVSPLAQAMVAPVVESSSTAEPDTFVTAPLVEPIERPVEVAEDGVAEAGLAEDGVAEHEVAECGAPEINAPTPIARPARATGEPTSPPTIEALLRRLEQGALRRGRIGTH
ncbi:hypothetical protein [Sphingomonas albertensis]|uniref:Uncharacterized protein n=1 Tax=Sphingomonas albertensis TaxID=2762591 RepID=A0ABR7AMZ2_9SPHN|nr:hypothetical protein [Sphingomonas albertensis]MBC3941672.1 hypothetical protein [Sphingomonas albertensis]